MNPVSLHDALPISAIAGPAIGGAMAARSSIPNVFLLVAILFLITAILIVFFVQESYVTTDRGKFNFKDFLPLLKHPLLIQVSLSAFALLISYWTLDFALAFNV